MKQLKPMIVALSMAVLLTGCTKLTMMTRDRSTVYIQDNGKVAGIFFEEFDKSYYDKDELEEYIDNEVSDQNAVLGKNSVKVNYFSVKNELAKVGFVFSDLESYNTFNACNIEAGTMDELEPKLEQEKISAFYTTDGKRIKKKNMELENTKAIMVDESIQVKVDGEILYVTKNVTMHEKHEDEAIVPGDGYSCIIYKEK